MKKVNIYDIRFVDTNGAGLTYGVVAPDFSTAVSLSNELARELKKDWNNEFAVQEVSLSRQEVWVDEFSLT